MTRRQLTLEHAADMTEPTDGDEDDIAYNPGASRLSTKEALKLDLFVRAEAEGFANDLQHLRHVYRLFTGSAMEEAEDKFNAKLGADKKFDLMELAVLKEYLRDLAKQDLAEARKQAALMARDELPSTNIQGARASTTSSQNALNAEVVQHCALLAEKPSAKIARTRVAKAHRVDGMQGYSLADYMADEPLRNAVQFIHAQYRRLQLDERDELLGAMEKRLGTLGAGPEEAKFLMGKVAATATKSTLVSPK